MCAATTASEDRIATVAAVARAGEVGIEALVQGQCCARSAIDSTRSGTLELERPDSPEMNPISGSICTF